MMISVQNQNEDESTQVFFLRLISRGQQSISRLNQSPYRNKNNCTAVRPNVSASAGRGATVAGIVCDSRGSRTDARPCGSVRVAPASPSV